MQDERNGLTYKQWIAQVDANLELRIGLGHEDVADFNSYDAWSDGMTPKEGADECIDCDDMYSESGL